MFTNFLLVMIRRRHLVFIAAIIWAIAGIYIAIHTPIDALPDLSENQVLVYTPWPNHDPPEIYRSVTRPLAQALQNIPGATAVRGSSDVGFSLLTIIFDSSISFPEARRRVGERLKESHLALIEGLQPQLAPEGIPTGQIVWYTLSGCDTDLLELRTWQEQFVAPRLRKLAGVAQVASVGGFEPELHVEVDPNALMAAGLSLGDFEKAISLNLQAIAPKSAKDFSSAGLAAQASALEAQFLPVPRSGRVMRVGDVSHITLQPAPRYGVFEKDGSEMVAGIVHLQSGANPLQVTRSVLASLQRIGDQLPSTLRLAPCYDRTRLISGAVSTVTRTLLEALAISTVCVVLIMRHFRTSLVIALTLPLAVLGAFLGMHVLSSSGTNIHTNIMSLAGIAISIGVLVDASVVIVENVTYQLKRQFGDQPVSGNTDHLVAEATAMVARPAVLSVLIMLVSFLPIFALGGIDGQLIQPLAWTKTLTLISVIVLTVTLVPALCRALIRGRIRGENESRILRSIISVYQPILQAACQRPWPLVVLLAALVILAAAAVGSPLAMRGAVVVSVGVIWLVVTTWRSRIVLALCVVTLALFAQSSMRPISLALRLPLDEGMVMDMPISLPRMTVSQAADDLKARNMVLCRFPEVQMVTGKAGRAETAFDPAPIDMIESMVEFRPYARWPKRRLMSATAHRHATRIVRDMIAAKLVEDGSSEGPLIDEITQSAQLRFDALQRELCWHLLQAFEHSLGNELTVAVGQSVAELMHRKGELAARPSDVEIRTLAGRVDRRDQLHLAQQVDANALHVVVREVVRALHHPQLQADSQASSQSGLPPGSQARLQPVLLEKRFSILEASLLIRLQSTADSKWNEFVRAENQLLYRRAGKTWTHLVVDELCMRRAIIDPEFASTRQQIVAARYAASSREQHHTGQHVGLPSVSLLPIVDPHPVYDGLIRQWSDQLSAEAWLWAHDSASLAGPGGELDAAVQMPGWANVWTRPIQNRIDMLTTGVSSEVGVRVLGDDFDSVVNASQQIAELVRQIPGAADVVADPIRDKHYTHIDVDTQLTKQKALDLEEVRVAVEATTRGYLIPAALAVASSRGQVRDEKSGELTHDVPVRLMIQADTRLTGDRVLEAKVPLRTERGSQENPGGDVHLVRLSEIAQVRHQDGPATIKSTGAQLSNYVRLNVRGRSATEWVGQAQAKLQQAVFPAGITLQWTGQFEHAARTRQNMLWMMPVCVALILLLLVLAFRDLADAMLMLMSIPGALAGAILAQWLLGFPFSLAVGVGYIACFGMAAATSMIMIVYLRQALADVGGLKEIGSLDQLQACVIKGAVHRLRPKLLTEATMILSLAPLLWSTGVGADVIRPMAAPVLGGILVADEVVDLLIPAMFFANRRKRWLSLASAPK